MLLFELEGEMWRVASKSERQQSWQGRRGLCSSEPDVKDFLLNSTSESFRCASSSGKRGEKLHSQIEKVPVAWVLSSGLPKLRPDLFVFYHDETETAGH